MCLLPNSRKQKGYISRKRIGGRSVNLNGKKTWEAGNGENLEEDGAREGAVRPAEESIFEKT